MKTKIGLVAVFLLLILFVMNIERQEELYINKLYIGDSQEWLIFYNANGRYIYVNQEKTQLEEKEAEVQFVLKYKGDYRQLESVGLHYFDGGWGTSTQKGLIKEKDLVFHDNNPRFWLTRLRDKNEIDVEITWCDGDDHKEIIRLKLQ